MSYVNTVLGPIPTDELGLTLIHEHITCGQSEGEGDTLAEPRDRKAIAQVCARTLEEVEAYGLETLVDATPIDLGRDVELLKEVSAISGVNIVCATGLYMEASGDAPASASHNQMFNTFSGIHETFLKEITLGVGDTGIKAGVIKVATGHGRISAYEETVLRAAARAHRETGVPIITHTEGGTMGPEQADLLISEGADPRRIVIGHMGGNADLRYHTTVLDKGVYIAFDRLGLEIAAPDTLRKACIIGLISIGYSEQIMVSHDYIAHWPGPTPVSSESLKLIGPNWSYTHVFRNIIPALREAGVTDDKINTLMVKNPRRLFAGE